MELKTARLRLRKLRLEDAPLLAALYGDPEVQKTLPQLEPVTVEREQAIIERHLEGMWANDGSGLFAVFEQSSGDFVGCCGHLFWDIDGTREAEVAYAIMPQHWRKGYATEAARALKEDAFTRLGKKRVISLIMPGNAGSAKVARNNGMRIEKQTMILDKFHVNVWLTERAAT
jgi:ribosomal-protein-alanine N-acetyltransferase